MDCRTDHPIPMTEAFLQIAGVFAQLELAMIRARVKSGMENARAKGKLSAGRKRRLKRFRTNLCGIMLYTEHKIYLSQNSQDWLA